MNTETGITLYIQPPSRADQYVFKINDYQRDRLLQSQIFDFIHRGYYVEGINKMYSFINVDEKTYISKALPWMKKIIE